MISPTLSPVMSPVGSPAVSRGGSPVGSPMTSPRPMYSSITLPTSNVELSNVKIVDPVFHTESSSTVYNRINLSKILNEKGYKILGKIIIDQDQPGKDGNTIKGKSVQYVRVLTPNGKTAFMSLDGTNADNLYIEYTPNDITMQKVSHGSRFPLSKRKGINGMLGYTIDGVVIMSHGDICVIKKLRNGNHEETNYLLPNSSSSSTQSETWMSVYPLVSYNDVINRPVETNEAIDNATITIQNHDRLVCDDNLKLLHNNINLMNAVSQQLIETIISRQKILDTNLKIFSNNIDVYRSNPPQDVNQSLLYEQSINGMKYSEQKLNDLLHLCHRLNLPTINEHLELLSKNISTAIEFLDTDKITISFPEYTR